MPARYAARLSCIILFVTSPCASTIPPYPNERGTKRSIKDAREKLIDRQRKTSKRKDVGDLSDHLTVT